MNPTPIQSLIHGHNHIRYTSIWSLPDIKSKNCTAAYQSYQDSTIRPSNWYHQPAAPHTNSGLNILTIKWHSRADDTDKYLAKRINLQTPIEFGGEAVKHYKKKRDSYQAPYDTPYEILYALDTTLLDPWPKHNTAMDFSKHVDMDFATHTRQELDVENGGQVDR
jgi:hypothetical protein